MIARVIAWSVERRVLVLLTALAVSVTGVQAIRETPIDALPDLSDVQVIVRTRAPGAAPQAVEDQLTFPLSASLRSVPGATTARGYSFFGDSFVHVLFDDDTDLYWASARVQEALAQAGERLPAAARPMIGPDATGVG
jgi:Cu(I)/Ag(I) efflux system membrane protein CusA/SilA